VRRHSDTIGQSLRRCCRRYHAGIDPYEEHDFGAFDVDGHTIMFKIDLYEEPEVKDSNGESVVNRVLTIMLAEEFNLVATSFGSNECKQALILVLHFRE
jgi:hypothetical protein